MQGKGRWKTARYSLLVLVLLCLPSIGLHPEPAARNYPTLTEQTFQITHKEVDDVYLLVSGLLSEEGSVVIFPKKSLITVKDSQSRMDQVRRLISNFDSPPDRVTFDIRLIKGVREPIGKDSPAEVPSDKVEARMGVPAGFTKVVNYQRFEVLGKYKLSGQEGRKINAGYEEETGFKLDIHIGHVDKARGIIVLEKLLLLQKVPQDQEGSAQGVKMEFSDILKNNHPRVFGKARTAGSTKALFVIIQAQIL